ncbi:MAG: YgiT-type zinc finger protein [Tepidisphaerales bacterium]
MLCEFDNAMTVTKRVSKHHRLDGKWYVVENVEAQVCPECGERYYSAKTLDVIDAVLRGEHTVKRHLDVEVVSL